MGDIFELFKKIGKEKKNALPIGHIVACLGNPGKEYALTRHNSGYLFAEYYSSKNGFRIDRAKFDGLYGDYTVAGERVLFLCPTTFMNASGISVRKAADYYKIPPEKIVVICDDVNFDVGKLRIRKKGSDGGQKGVRSIIERMDSDEFPRIKIGIGKRPDPEYDMKDWVLSKFTPSELEKLKDVFDNCAAALELILEGDIEKAMCLYN